MGSPRSTKRDLQRYAGLFAARTKVMTSSAMRDLMAITERDEVISLAGGLPDTSTFPPESYASIMERVAMESSARALQYGPTEGLEVLKNCIVEVMAEEGCTLHLAARDGDLLFEQALLYGDELNLLVQPGHDEVDIGAVVQIA